MTGQKLDDRDYLDESTDQDEEDWFTNVNELLDQLVADNENDDSGGQGILYLGDQDDGSPISDGGDYTKIN